ncbi:VWA domain-containing protein [Blastococcus atacamensis]|uniref:VWA domain-containing protein n=1 Tax=Blastococcus atacamensis TaxID=2070508 RepID=UPI001E4052F1|nr:VWA domain-containing protein [Blastococcus atacamensis]
MPPVLLAAGLAVLLLLGGIVWWVTGSGCGDRRTVDVTVAPELAGLTEDLLADVAADEDACVDPVVTAQEPLQTSGDLSALEADALPDVWVPDSSLWTARAGKATLDQAGSMALSPVVLATSRAAAGELGWLGLAPTWGQAVGSGRPLAVPDLAASAEGLSALAAVRTSLGGDEDADNAVVQAVLAAARNASPSPADALTAGTGGSAQAPLVPMSEQEVYAANDAAADSRLVAVYPAEGTPSLDYPVLRVGSPSGEEDEEEAVEAVVRRLLSEDAQVAVRDAGFRGPEGSAPPRAGKATGIAEDAPETLSLDPAEVQGLLARLSSLAAPSRILAVFDVSTSMEAPVGDGTRATLARDAAKSTLSLVPGNYALGLWAFAYELEGDRDWVSLVPTRELAAEVDGSTQRDVLDDQLDTIPGRLTAGGTGLYDTTLAAVRAAREDYDPTAVNSVLVLTDGTNEDDADGVTLEALLSTLAAEADPARPIKVIGVALGPDADLRVLERIAEATGGAAYSAVDESDLQTVLFDALRQRG